MSNSRQRARDLLTAYDHSLEQQIVGRGSNLACRDEELWELVEGQLRDGDAQDTHRLGLDPLRVMEESLKAAAASAAAMAAVGAGQVRARGGLQGLAKAFEVLEQAALNLYLGPWRDEYKVVKMYSGMFTHYIKPVLSMAQIEKLFGLLGYQPSSSRHEQLFRQGLRLGPPSVDDLLRLSCAFYLARCECRLLRAALGKHADDAQWELSVVRERQRGHSLQVALDNTKKTLRVNQPVMEPFHGEADVDLYTDEHVNGGQREPAAGDDESPRSLAWLTQRSESPPSAKTQGNGTTSLSPTAGSLPTREHPCVSTLNCQLKMESSAAGKRRGRRPREESRSDEADAPSGSLQPETTGFYQSEAGAGHFCSCLQSPHPFPHRCIECETLHNISCALLQHCILKSHMVVSSYKEDAEESGAASPQSERASDPRASPPLVGGGSPALSSLVLCDEPDPRAPSLRPIAYHDCCNLAQLDPQVLCRSCSIFHSGPCRKMDYCQAHHAVKQLGVCACGKACARKPLVLCRYCGSEYCSDCWYRSPVACTCGQTFDQSSSV